MEYKKTSEKLISENYPYGFRLKTTKTDYLEFSKTHGFRHCSFTINPKTGLANKPKKSTYYPIMLLGRDELNHVASKVFDFYGNEGFDKVIKFFAIDTNFDLFTPEQIEYIYMQFLVHIKTDIHAQVVYCGSKPDDIFPLFEKSIDIVVQGIKDKGTKNYFSLITFDWEKINSFKVEGYQPFKVVQVE